MASAAPKWAFVALVLLLTGFAVGRFGTGEANPARVRASIESELRKALLQELAVLARKEATSATVSTLRAAGQEAERIAASYAQGLQAQRVDDRRAIEASLERLEAQRVTDLATLKRELDTLAVNTDAGLRHTAEGLVQLANYRGNPPASESSHTSTQ